MFKMKRPHRQFLPLIAVAAALLSALHDGLAEDWPTRPLTMVVPYVAGGATDIVARMLNTRLSEVLGQQVIIENIGGSGGMTGANRVAKAAPDGYQFVLGNVGTHAQNQTLYKRPSYHAATDFAPVALLVDQPMVLVARTTLPADNLPEFIAYAKANADKMQYGSAGTGSPTHLSCALFNAAAGLKITHVPYRGSGASMQDLIGGRIDYHCLNTASAFGYIESKTVKAIAILAKTRSPALPSLASADEQGLSGFTADNWLAFFYPKGTPAPIVKTLHDAAVAAITTPALAARLKEIGVDVVAPERRSPEYLQTFVESQIEKWAAPIKAAGVSMD
jgi:tripartite-type tricarboxylate transporter receptor subunit TctC